MRALIDFTEPAGLLITAVMNFIPDGGDPWGLTGRYIAVSGREPHSRARKSRLARAPIRPRRLGRQEVPGDVLVGEEVVRAAGQEGMDPGHVGPPGVQPREVPDPARRS